jgi:serralysin
MRGTLTWDIVMTSNIYRIDLLAANIGTTTITDDGTGRDWLIFYGSSVSPSVINLQYSTIPASAAGSYTSLTPTLPSGYIEVSHALIVNGLIENARGSDGMDAISGNASSNILYGDHLAGGIGGADTLNGFGGNDSMFGGADSDEIYGHSGNDNLHGDAGNDTIDGGSGNDTLIGGAGADSLFGGWNARDLLSYAGSNAGVEVEIVRSGTSLGIGGDAEGDILSGFADVMGSNYDDQIRAINGLGLFSGFAENRFYGGAGNDFLSMGDGNDSGYGGTDTDWLALSAGADLGYGGAGSDFLEGGNGNDTLYGGAGNDQIYGDGNDSLSTGSGADHLFGGLGADVFLFANGESPNTAVGRDVIHDFSRAEADHITLWPIDANPNLNDFQAFTWRGSLAFTGGYGQLRVMNSGANTLVLGDLDGDKIADFSILVLGINNMIKADFILSVPSEP